MRIEGYATLIFDCDGVVLDSNHVKTEAFRHTAAPWGMEVSEALIAYHVANGGVSRYAKFAYFLERILPQYALGRTPEIEVPGREELLSRFAHAVRDGLLSCSVAAGLDALRSATPNARWLIVSGGDQTELREIFAVRDLAEYFDGGIFGSPDPKPAIVSRELARGNIQHPAVFLGDSRFDHEVAEAAAIDFIFVSEWTEVKDWSIYVRERQLKSVENLSRLIELLP